ncbi:hypothetical protein D9M72_648000 [compost metagenome]
MRHHQADEADRAGEGDHDAGQKCCDDEENKAKPANGNAERHRRLVAHGKRIDLTRPQHEVAEAGRQHHGGIDEMRPLGEPETAEHPEDHRMHRPWIPEENHQVTDRRQGEGDGHA